jgi:hypothetical protein
MGIPVLILGYSGSGKTRSIKHMNPETTGIFLVEKPRLPFRETFKVVKNAGYPQIMAALRNPTMKSYVIDDSQYLLVNEFFDKANEKGYEKFTQIALNFRNLIHWVNIGLPDDVIVYFLHHIQTDDVSGRIKAKTIGRMLDEKLTVEGCFDVVMMTERNQDGWWFRTHTAGADPVKTPEDMFTDDLIPNDLAEVDKAIRDYYRLEENNNGKD